MDVERRKDVLKHLENKVREEQSRDEIEEYANSSPLHHPVFASLT